MPPSVRDYNQMAPFWDFVAGLEEQGSTHPFFANFNNMNNNNDDGNGAQDAYDEHQRDNPWSQGWGSFPFGSMPHRGRHGHHGPPGPPPGHEHDRHGSHGPGPRGPPPPPGHEHGGHGGPGPYGPPPPHGHEHGRHGPHGPGSRGPPPPPGHEHGGPGPHGPPPPHGHRHGKRGPHGRGPSPPPGHNDDDDMTPTSEDDNDPEEVVLGADGVPQVNETSNRGPGGRHHGHHGRRAHDGPRCGGRGRGGWGGRGRGGPFGPRGFGNPMAGGFGALATMFQDQLFGQDATTTNDQKAKDGEDFKPEVDVFDTTESFIVHISLPGAKKEDLGVHWDAEKSELNVSGVVHRPGDEELLKTLALDERKVGAFARKVRLGSRANPAQVDVDGISAKLEDGILRVDVPKQDGGYVEIKKVDIE